jgi:uncharacterized membrane protein
MLEFFLWYLLITALGWLAFPLAFRLLPALSDRGYALARTLGWLLWGFIFWLLASLGVLRNTSGGLLLAAAPLVAMSVWAWRSLASAPGQDGGPAHGRGRPHPLRLWLGANRRLVITVELVLLAAFAWMAFVRAANPEAAGTEKPMELAFINAILRSPAFPPHDPWLSGYAISYYYFGYVLAAMLGKLAGSTGGVVFNLGLSLVFALTALGAYGLVYNLLASRSGSQDRTKAMGGEEFTAASPVTVPGGAGRAAGLAAPLLGPLFVLFVSNLEGFLHSLHNRGLFWTGGRSAFWEWLGIPDLNMPPAQPLSWAPQRFWWWWRASRVVQDFDLLGNSKGDIIDEFPAFSFLLGDLHPHVLAMPFAFLAMLLALNLFLGGARGRPEGLRLRLPSRALAGVSLALAAAGLFGLFAAALNQRLPLGLAGLTGLLAGGLAFAGLSTSSEEAGLRRLAIPVSGGVTIGPPLYLGRASFFLAALTLGGLAFLNTWDFPVYTALLAGAYALRCALEESAAGGHRPSPLSFVRHFVWSGLALGLAGVLLYLPFYLGFSSQAGGVIPNLVFATRGAHLWVMFAPLWLPLIAYLLFLWKRHGDRASFGRGLLAALGFALLLWLLALLLTLVVLAFGDRFFTGLSALFLSVHGAPDGAALLRGALERRLEGAGGWVSLVLLLAGLLGLFLSAFKAWGSRAGGEGEVQPAPVGDEAQAEAAAAPVEGGPARTAALSSLSPLSFTDLFALLLILLGTLMVLGPEFFFLRDVFGTRINTIFKFYFQAWLLWGGAAAFGSAVLLKRLRGGWRLAFSTLLVLVIAAGLVYPVFGIWSKTNGFEPAVWTLDGSADFALRSPDEMAAIEWLRQAPLGVVAAAVAPEGGSYTEYASVATHSGQPAVLGWIGHERQWRGGAAEIGARQQDLERLYCTRDWIEAQSILDQYNIRYVYVGVLERSTYTPASGNCRTGLDEEKFESYLNPVFRQGGAAVYEVLPATSGS